MPRPQIGPGPAKYMLPPLTGYPNHDVSKYRNPQYSFGLSGKTCYETLGPGPKYHVCHFNQYGKESPPAYSLKSRPKPLEPFRTPGPYYYKYRTGPWPPAYRLVSRKPPLKPFLTPAPNQYSLPQPLGCKIPDKTSGPCYTMRKRFPIREYERSPGPARYDASPVDLYKNRQPKYTMRPQLTGVKEKCPSPGPAAYMLTFQSCNKGITMQSRTDKVPYITPEDNMPCINK